MTTIKENSSSHRIQVGMTSQSYRVFIPILQIPNQMGEHFVAADRAAGVRNKPGEDALPVERVFASPETHRCALRQRLHAYAAVAVLRRNQDPTVLKRRQVDDEPVVHPKGEVEVEAIDPTTRLVPQPVQNVVRHDDVPLLRREVQVLQQPYTAKNLAHSSHDLAPAAQLPRRQVEIQHHLFAGCSSDIVLIQWGWEGAGHPPELVRPREEDLHCHSVRGRLVHGRRLADGEVGRACRHAAGTEDMGARLDDALV